MPIKNPKREKLKACPFDGAKANLEERAEGHMRHFVMCSRCHARTTYYRIQSLAVVAWQRRVS